MTTVFKIFSFSVLFLLSNLSFSQTQAAKIGRDGEPLAKRPETKLTEVIQIVGDTALESELIKRANIWFKAVNPKYIKSGGGTSGNKIECNVDFAVKPKELNPETDFTGKLTMKVVVECKDNRWKYTVSDLKHISKSGECTGGSIDNVVPECGSMALGDILWKKLRGEAVKGANMVVTDLKLVMDKKSEEVPTEEW
jgi:hypothetical protein